MKRLPTLCFLFIVVALQFLCAEERVITAIDISGLKRTKRFVAEQPLQKFVGQDGATLDMAEVFAAVKGTGILEPLDAALEDDPDDPDRSGITLKVIVEEKWSIFPLPLVYISAGNWSVGGFFVDTNAFGLNDKFVIGGLYGGNGWSAMGSYIHMPMGQGALGGSLLGSFSRQERVNADQNNRALRRFSIDTIRVAAGLSYTLTEALAASLRFSFENKALRDNADAFNAPTAGAMALGIGAGVSWRQSGWDGYLLSERSASLDYTGTLGLASPSFHAVKGRVVYERSLIPGFKLNLHGGGIYAPDAPPLFETGPQSAQVNILPSSFSAQHYVGASVGLEKYLFKFPFGVLSLLAAYQTVYSYGPLLDHTFDHGVVGMLAFYLSKIAIPALNGGIAYNVAAHYLQGSFSLGMSF
jgi:hypothetical protein